MLTQNRTYRYDTMRFLLLFLVILGHGLELCMDGQLAILYRLIYSFHMGAFLFLTGKFARFDPKKVLRHLCLPYFVFQILYLCFQSYVLYGTELVLQFTTPYWILWYLLVTIFCYLLLPILPEKGSKSALLLIPGAFVLALLAGYDKTLGYYLSLSRFLVFLPFFLWGYYQDSLQEMLKLRGKTVRILKIIIALALIALCSRYLIQHNVPNNLLYGSYSYAACESTLPDRLVSFGSAIGWITLLDTLIPNRRIPILSTLGQNTMPVFLFHGFCIRLLGKYGVLHYSTPINLLLVCLVSLSLIALLGNPLIGKLFKKVF